ncbi:SDR family oxidoreductase [Nocardioides sp. AX2bis]|uniref:SDR family oxidoreductase n=1 Tax=Nocardioides sp. AX2bis TaxID=2653157 RepID=UPI0012F20513|nr:SDR family oxidoreductase [Nocardioides sp. AX2bis]VXC26447.1 Short-chain dehydrogenase [Nocardioides sp. AX2bis]
MTDIQDAVAVVTGGQRGLGRAFAAELLARGAAKVYVTARDPRADDDARIEAVALDVTDDRSVTALAELAHDATVVFNNAGVLHPSSLLTGPMTDVTGTFETNVFGALRIARAFAPVLAANGGGALVDMHSLLSWGSGAGAYGASKAALWSITNSLRTELASQGTHVVGVHLGFADTDMVAAMPGDKLAPAEVATIVLDGIEQGEIEILVDDVTRHFKRALSGPVEGLAVPLG